MSKCPACGAETEGKFCEFCGAEMPVEGAAPAAAASSAETPAQEDYGTEQYGNEDVAGKEEYGTEDYGASNEPVIEKTMEVTDKKCPSCGGTLVFDPETGGLTCEFCGYQRELPKPEAGQEIVEMDFESAKNRASFDWGNKMKTVCCQQCGGETVYDALETAAVCPFCGSTSVMPVEGIEDVMAPGGVVPFAITEKQAADLFRAWMSHKWFAPNDAKKSCSAKGFNGVYLPYWTYDSDTTSRYTAQVGYDKKQGDKTVTTWKNTSGVYTEFIDDFTVFASNKTDNNPYIKSVSTFDFSKLRPYTPEIVAGFGAERYSVGLDDGWKVAQAGIKRRLSSNMSSTIRRNAKADHVRNLQFSTAYDNITFKYLLAPVWLAAFKYKDKVYNIVINGQTGKVGGASPISPIKVALFVLGLIVLAIILYYFFGN